MKRPDTIFLPSLKKTSNGHSDRSTIQALLFLCSSISLVAQTPFSLINDSTVARYRYESIVHKYAEIPAGITIEDLDVRERDYLSREKSHTIICSGINSRNEPFFETRTISTTKLEDWLEPAYLQLITPSMSFGYDSLGGLIYQYDHNADELADRQKAAVHNYTYGWQPVMLFFPSKHDDFVQEAINSGAHFQLYPDNSFKLTYSGYWMIVNPMERSIEASYSYDNKTMYTRTEYLLLAPYGYVPSFEEVRQTRVDLTNPITQVEKTIFKNHVIEDYGNKVEKYTDVAHIEIFSNPVEAQYEVLLQGLPEAAVSQVLIRDYMGNIVQSHLNPTLEQDILSLDGSAYPSGALIILVHTQHGIYSETLTKL